MKSQKTKFIFSLAVFSIVSLASLNVFSAGPRNLVSSTVRLPSSEGSGQVTGTVDNSAYTTALAKCGPHSTEINIEEWHKENPTWAYPDTSWEDPSWKKIWFCAWGNGFTPVNHQVACNPPQSWVHTFGLPLGGPDHPSQIVVEACAEKGEFNLNPIGAIAPTFQKCGKNYEEVKLDAKDWPAAAKDPSLKDVRFCRVKNSVYGHQMPTPQNPNVSPCPQVKKFTISNYFEDPFFSASASYYICFYADKGSYGTVPEDYFPEEESCVEGFQHVFSSKNYVGLQFGCKRIEVYDTSKGPPKYSWDSNDPFADHYACNPPEALIDTTFKPNMPWWNMHPGVSEYYYGLQICGWRAESNALVPSPGDAGSAVPINH